METSPMNKDVPATARAAFLEIHGAEPTVVSRAPGRVNLIGEHTDYNDGFVLPMALPFETALAVAPSDKNLIELVSPGYGSAAFAPDADPKDTPRWARYVHGMALMLIESGTTVSGFRGVISSNIPLGASLSSSAALEMAAGIAMLALAGESLPPAQLARLGQRVENEIIGINSGIMDQIASAGCEAGSASLIDCRSLEFTPVPLPAGVTVVVMDTGTRRELVDSEYDLRRAACDRAAAALGVGALRDATLEQVATLPDSMELERRRAHHVVTANARALATVEAMRAGDNQRVGELMNESHTSLRDDYEVSGPALDQIVEIAQSVAGCFGARMTGGGFAGCAVALVDSALVEDFVADVLARYSALDIAEAALWPCLPSAGASLA